MSLLIAALLLGFGFALGESREDSERSGISYIKKTSDQVATFTLQVIDTNATTNSNQSTTLGNSTQRITVTCEPLNIELRQGKLTTIFCKVNNSGYRDVELVTQIIGLEGTEIQYTINGYGPIETISVLANSSKTFDVGMQAYHIKEYDVGKSYDYTIRLSCFDYIDCY